MAAQITIRNPHAPVSPPQERYLAMLLRTRGKTYADLGTVEPTTMGAASTLIDRLRTMPEVPPIAAAVPAAFAAPAPRVTVEDGYYAVQALGEPLRFYRVHTNTTGAWKGRQFTKRYASDDLIKISPWERAEAHSLIAADPQAARETFARELGKCMYCGRTLTDTDSRLWLYGPDCARQRTLPHGAHPANPLHDAVDTVLV